MLLTEQHGGYQEQLTALFIASWPLVATPTEDQKIGKKPKACSWNAYMVTTRFQKNTASNTQTSSAFGAGELSIMF